MRRRDLFKGALAALFAAKLPMPSTMTVPVAPAVAAYSAMPYGLSIEITSNMWHDDHYGAMRELLSGLKTSADAARERLAQKSIWSMTPDELAAAYPGASEPFEYDD